MSSIQERLQLKRVPLDTWNVREQLCLASAVVRSGDQNWMSVSRALKTVGEPNRPPDWYSQKSCAAQYGALLEHVETPKRKKRSSEGAVETPQESILKRLTQDRILEIQKTLADMNQQYEQLQNEIAEAHNPATTEERLQELWNGIEAAKRTRERENARRAAWLKERGERRARAERNWRPPSVDTASPTPPAPSSPLLTSLLKSSPVVTTPQHISHPATVVDTVSPSAGAPTLSMLLEKSGSTSPHEKHAAIEHIKSQLVQIEQQLKAGTSAPPPATLPAPPPAVDIDDIEIKAEDVYAFRDVDIHIPPQAALHRPAPRLTEKLVVRKEETPPVELVPETENMEVVEEEKVEPPPTESVSEDVVAAGLEMHSETPPEENEPEQPAPRQPTPEPEVKISFPEVKFPTPEIKVIQPENTKYKEEIREVEPPPPEVKQEKQIEEEVEKKIVVEVPVVQEEIVPELKEVEEIQLKIEPEDKEEVSQPEVTEEKAEELPPVSVETPLAREPTPEAQVEGEQEPAAEPQPLQPEVPPEEPEVRQEAQVAPEEPLVEEVIEVKQKTEEELQKDEDAEDSIPLKEMMKEESLHASQSQPKEEKQEVEETHTETDDDTPMELSREEEKDGKKKRDYSRKKKSDSRNRSGSESAEASAPESPSAGDAERQHRLWRKSVMLVYTRLCAHKYASLFLRPISDEEAPGYSSAVKRPMDLSAIRRNIDNGVIRTTAEFQRDVLLMLSNALMYNSSEHSVYSMAREMFEEAQGQLGMLLAAQAHAGLEPPPRRKRRAAERH